VKCRLPYQLARCTNRACCQSHPVKMFIKATMPRDKRNRRILGCFLRQTHKVFGCLHFWVFNLKLGLSTAVKCDPVFRVCVNDPLSIHIPDNWSWQWNTWLQSTDVGVRAHSRQSFSLLIALTEWTVRVENHTIRRFLAEAQLETPFQKE
jgi:hypothetical protein